MMVVHAFFMINRTIDIPPPKKKKKLKFYTCTKSMESCSLVASQILAEFHLERATFKTLHYIVLLNGLSKFAQNFYWHWVLKCFLLTQSTLLLGGNFPFKVIVGMIESPIVLGLNSVLVLNRMLDPTTVGLIVVIGGTVFVQCDKFGLIGLLENECDVWVQFNWLPWSHPWIFVTDFGWFDWLHVHVHVQVPYIYL